MHIDFYVEEVANGMQEHVLPNKASIILWLKNTLLAL